MTNALSLSQHLLPSIDHIIVEILLGTAARTSSKDAASSAAPDDGTNSESISNASAAVSNGEVRENRILSLIEENKF